MNEPTISAKSTYTPALKKAIMKHRLKNKENYNSFHRAYYQKQGGPGVVFEVL